MRVRIGELSRRTGVSVRLLRYYEEQGLLQPVRSPGGYREYREGDIVAVRQIRALLAAGLGTSLIAGVLPCMREDGDHLVPTCAEMLDDLHEVRDRMTSHIDELRASRDRLDAVIEAAPSVAEASRAEGTP